MGSEKGGVTPMPGSLYMVVEHFKNKDAAALPQSRRADALRDGRVLAGLRGEVEQRVAAGVALAFDLPHIFTQALIEPGVADVARNIEEPPRECRPYVGVELGVLAELLHTRAHFFAEVVVDRKSVV